MTATWPQYHVIPARVVSPRPLCQPLPPGLSEPYSVSHNNWSVRATVTLPSGFCLFLSGCLGEYSSQWAHFLSEKITYIHFREKKRGRNEITEPGNKKEREKQDYRATILGEFLWVVNHLVSGARAGDGCPTPSPGRPSSGRSGILSVRSHSALSPCPSLRSSGRSVMLDGYEFRRAGGQEEGRGQEGSGRRGQEEGRGKKG